MGISRVKGLRMGMGNYTMLTWPIAIKWGQRPNKKRGGRSRRTSTIGPIGGSQFASERVACPPAQDMGNSLDKRYVMRCFPLELPPNPTPFSVSFSCSLSPFSFLLSPFSFSLSILPTLVLPLFPFLNYPFSLTPYLTPSPCFVLKP